MPRPARIPPQLSFDPFRGSEAVAAGLITWRMLDGPAWRRLLPDVYVHVDSYFPDDHRMWCMAAVARLTSGAAICGLSAAYLWGVDLLPLRPRIRGGGTTAPVPAAPVQVALPRSARPDPHPRINYVYWSLDKGDVTSFFNGLTVTTEVRTAFDLGRSLPRAEALGAIDALLHRRLLTPERLMGYVDAHPGVRGVRQVRELLPLAEPLSASPMESRLRLLLHDAGLPKPTPQYVVRVTPPGVSGESGALGVPRGVVIGRVDLAYPQWRIAIEYEGDHHRERATFRKDVHRFNALRQAGWLALRFTADDVLRRSAELTQTVRQAIAERAGSVPATPPR
ncbi:DUF559 domain-containing protein [Micromonospora sp. NBC_01813]|uniref:DUF559 domain-containing protein n=1 Tax=Micromonospora sp. NBC_01813 TaxID=2975988 RepID=UPI002DDAA251|nr:DUF559 domain-containing protein [Micromonospora sp. NBC_01813]WSA08832.1 endonuclease domain-containing protein [Micromonospora sp. NBC_01813]